MAARVGNIVPEGLWNGSNGSCRSASFEEPCLSHLVLHNLPLVGTWGSRTFWSCGSVCWIFFPLKGNLAATFWVASVDARTACIRALLPPPPPPKEGLGCHRLRCLQAYRSAQAVGGAGTQQAASESRQLCCCSQQGFFHPWWRSQLSGSCTH